MKLIRKTALAICCLLLMLAIVTSPIIYEELSGENATGNLGYTASGVLAKEEASAQTAKSVAEQNDKDASPLADERLKMNTVSVYKAPSAVSSSVLSVGGTVSVSSEQLAYAKEVSIVATAYCSCYSCCAPYDGSATASGAPPRAYHTIAAPRDYAFGTKVYIPYFANAQNGGMFVVEDRGGAITGNKIDVYFSSHEEALRFGRRSLTMYVLE